MKKVNSASKHLFAQSARFLPPSQYTIAEALHDAGYATGHFGKWHLGKDEPYWPETQGFDVSFHGAPDAGPPSYSSPYGFPKGTVTDGPKGEYIADRLTDEAIRFMKANRDKPFFVNLWHYNVHGPWGHKQEYTDYFKTKTDPRGKQKNPIMGSMLKSLDESLGRVLDTIDQLGLKDDTIVVFFSDNGGNNHSRDKSDSKVAKLKPNSNGWKSVQAYYKDAGQFVPPTNNEPLRGGKGMLYEGGTRVPMMVRWPGHIAAGAVNDTTVCSIDFYPTLLDFAGVAPKKGQPIDGVSLAPLLTGQGKIEREAIFNYFPFHGTNGVLVRKGPWQLIRFFETSAAQPNEVELYNLADDIGETKNLAPTMPEKVAELSPLIERFMKEVVQYPPKPNPKYDPARVLKMKEQKNRAQDEGE